MERHFICTACPLLCDDIVVHGDRFFGICRHGYERLVLRSSDHRCFKAKSGCSYIDTDKAIEIFVDLAKNSRNILIYGMDFSSNEAIDLWVEVAKKLRASIAMRPRNIYAHVFHIGLDRYIVNLEYVREYSDLLIFVNCDPPDTITRLVSRYIVFPRGKKAPEGRENRIIISIDVRKSHIGSMANYYIQTFDLEADIDRIARRIMGENVAPPQSMTETRFAIMLNDIMKAEVPTIVMGCDGPFNSLTVVKAVKKLIEALCYRGKDVKLVVVPCSVSEVKLAQVMKKIDPSLASYSYSFEECRYIDALGKDWRFDMVILVGSDPLTNLPISVLSRLFNTKLVVVDNRCTLISGRAELVIPIAIQGIEESASFTRLDGVEQHVKKLFDPPSEVISEIELVKTLAKSL